MAGAGIEGGDRLAATLHAAGAALVDLVDVNAAAGGLVHAVAVRRAPRRSGRLAGSLTTKATATGVVWGSTEHYSVPVHFGSRYMTARPFYTEAIDTQETAIADLYTEHVTDVLDTVKGI